MAKSDQHISCEVVGSLHKDEKFYLTAIYGINHKESRRELWKNLRDDCVTVGGSPTIVGRDFNVMRSVDEAMGGNLPNKEYFWKKHENCMEIVKGVWKEEMQGHGLDILHRKMKMLNGKLRELNEASYSHISTRVLEKYHELSVIQTEFVYAFLDAGTIRCWCF
ncbi:hypothetical protein LIER_16472 [Lithospermum erythrorhizon]|uniref:Uncharacterized protein n=1 Tax=Lithospermum erythrorhizon TaxID=34254 RepID=A0AAV3Q9C5_LITER